MIRHWLSGLRLHCLLCGAVLLASAGLSRAGDNDSDLRDLVIQQGKQIEELKRQIQATQVQPVGAVTDPAHPKADDVEVKKIVATYLQEQEANKQAADAQAKAQQEAEGYKVGTDLGISAHWDYHNGVWFETPHKDFTAHMGFRIQEDTVGFQQTIPVSQVGDFQDGTYFRRIRPYWEGTVWEVFEFKAELALEQVKQGIPTLDEVWVDMTKIPWIGTIRVGHQRVPTGFEGDMSSSSQAMTFMEKAFETDAMYGGENFAPGICAMNSFCDQRMTYAADIYKQELLLDDNTGTNFSDGKIAVSGRLTWLPIYCNNGREWLHLGVSGTWRDAGRQNTNSSTPNFNNVEGVELRARPEMRDAIGDFGGATVGTVTLPGDTKRLADTGLLECQGESILGTEFCYVRGPFSVQAEWAVTNVDDVTAIQNSSTTLKKVPGYSPWFDGGYVEVSYFLTGENRIYDRRYGRLGTYYIDRPYTPFWITRDANGGLTVGRGAWEVAARYSYLNLNDGVVQGGVLDGLEAGVNWYLNNNIKLQFEYMYNQRMDKDSAVNGNTPGTVQAFGTRVQWQF